MCRSIEKSSKASLADEFEHRSRISLSRKSPEKTERRENERLQLALLSYYYAAPSVHFYISYFIRGI